MKKMRSLASYLAIISMFFSLLCFDVDAGSRSSSSSSGSRPSSSSSSRPTSSFSKPSTKFSSPSPIVSKPSPTFSKPLPSPTISKPATTFSKPSVASSINTNKTSSVATRTPAQQAVFTKAKENGTLYTNKSQAVNDFKSKHASTYTSTYKSEPSKRPEHIPTSTTVNNKNVNITYNQSRGGYGYYSGGGPGIGTWIMYDMMSDAVMMSAMMNRHNYVVHSQPVHNTTVHTESYADYNNGGYYYLYNTTLFLFFAFIVVFVIIGLSAKRLY